MVRSASLEKKTTVSVLSVVEVILFYFFSRTIYIYYFYENATLNYLYTSFSKVFTVAIMAVFFLLLLQSDKKTNIGLLLPIVTLVGVLLVSTFINNGVLQRLVQQYYPIIAMACLLSVSCRTLESTKRFIATFSGFWLVLSGLNLFLLLFFPGMFGQKYFLGLENQIGFSLVLGVLFCSLDRIYNKHKFRWWLYMAVYFVTIVLIWSGSNMIAALFLGLCMFVPFIRVLIKKINLTVLFSILLVFFAIVILLGAFDFFETGFAKWIIEDFLGKDSTLTGRTLIWKQVVDGFTDKPWLGHGIGETNNLFYIYVPQKVGPAIEGVFSAHNQFLETLYEGGLLTFVLMLVMVVMTSRKMKQCQNSEVTTVFKITILSVSLMLMSESAGFDCLFCLLNFAYILCALEKREPSLPERLPMK